MSGAISSHPAGGDPMTILDSIAFRNCSSNLTPLGKLSGSLRYGQVRNGITLQAYLIWSCILAYFLTKILTFTFFKLSTSALHRWVKVKVLWGV